METGINLTVALLAGVLFVLSWLAWRLARLGRDLGRLAGGPPSSLQLLQREVQAVRAGVDERLREHVEQAQELNQRLGWLEKATQSVEQLGSGLEELHRILRPAQLRGAFGERLLEELLADVLPRDRFRVQYSYPTSGVRVDVAVLLGGGRILPIDSKFPLDNFRRFLELDRSAGPEAEAARRAFGRDVRRHVDDIAAKYLSPEDGAVDVVFMYIPSEAVFQELTGSGPEDDGALLTEYAVKKRVVPVSPNTLHAYLSVVRMGLRGFQLQRNAREILEHLTHLQSDVEQLRSEMDTALKQARHSLNNLTEAEAALRRAEARLARLGGLGGESDPASH